MADQKETGDTGLGMNEFLGGEATAVAETPEAETKEPEAKELEAKEEKSEETKVEEKESEIKTEEKSEEKVEEKTEEKADETKIEEKKPEINWREKAELAEKSLETANKRQRDSANAFTQVNQRLVELQRAGEITNKKIDGTYDPAVDDVPIQTADQAKQIGEFEGRFTASRGIAEATHGAEKVESILTEFNTKYAQDPIAQAKILQSPTPVIEAMNIVENGYFIQKHGNNPSKIVESITKMVLEKHGKEMEDKLTKNFNEKLKLKESQPDGIGEASGSKSDAKTTRKEVPLDDIFPDY